MIIYSIHFVIVWAVSRVCYLSISLSLSPFERCFANKPGSKTTNNWSGSQRGRSSTPEYGAHTPFGWLGDPKMNKSNYNWLVFIHGAFEIVLVREKKQKKKRKLSFDLRAFYDFVVRLRIENLSRSVRHVVGNRFIALARSCFRVSFPLHQILKSEKT